MGQIVQNNNHTQHKLIKLKIQVVVSKNNSLVKNNIFLIYHIQTLFYNYFKHYRYNKYTI